MMNRDEGMTWWFRKGRHLLASFVLLGLLLMVATAALGAESSLAAAADGVVEDVRLSFELKGQLMLNVQFRYDREVFIFADLVLVEPLVGSGEPSTTFRTQGLHLAKTWASVTLLPDERLSGVFSLGKLSKMINVDTVSYVRDRRLNDVKAATFTSTVSCGTITDVETSHSTSKGRRLFNKARDETRPPPDPLGKDRARHEIPHKVKKTGRSLATEQWFSSDTCFNNDATTRRLSIGIVVDASLEQRVLSSTYSTVEKYVELLIASVSAIYLAQMNIELVVKQILKPSSADSAAAIALTNPKRKTGKKPCSNVKDPDSNEIIEVNCCEDGLGLGDRLEMLRAWSASLPIFGTTFSRQAHWHLLTDCHQAPGQVGKTFIGTLCHLTHSAGLTAYGDPSDPAIAHWRMLAHEIGHAFNASHSFEYGMGHTGGIMDYGNGKYLGEYQFHPFRRAEVCSEIASQVESCAYFEPAVSPRCGDGIVERMKGEECECLVPGQTQCADCIHCRHAPGSQCVRGSSTCCSSTGQFLFGNTKCAIPETGRPGVCVMGTCQDTVCPANYVPCGAPEVCRTRCAPRNSPFSCSASYQNLPDDTPCQTQNAPDGVCVSGACVRKEDQGSEPSGDCKDLVSPWWDADGAAYTCAWYSARPAMCQEYGYRLKNFGFTAMEACCGCGGGRRPTSSPVPDSQKVTQAPTSSPTQAPTCPTKNVKTKCKAFKAKAKCNKNGKAKFGCAWCTKKNNKKKSIGVCVPGPCSLAKSCGII